MLGEDHSLAKEFPQHLETIAALAENDGTFAANVKRYDALDREIRHLELEGAPIDDEAMHQLKNERAALKDALYRRLVESS